MKNLSKGFPHIEKLFVEKVKIIVSWILNEAAWKIQIDAQTYDFKTLLLQYLGIYLSTHVRGEPVLTRVGSECCCGVTCRDADSSLPDLKRKLCISGHFRSFSVIFGHFRSFQIMFWPALEAVPFLIFVIFSPVPREWCGEVRMDRIKQSSPGRLANLGTIVWWI